MSLGGFRKELTLCPEPLEGFGIILVMAGNRWTLRWIYLKRIWSRGSLEKCGQKGQ